MVKKDYSKTLASSVAKSASDLKAIDIQVMNLSKLASFTDFFVVCSGTSDRHVRAIADNIELEQKKNGIRPIGVEGYDKGDWILVDFGSVVAHVFHTGAREFYGIERLWGDAKHVSIKNVTG